MEEKMKDLKFDHLTVEKTDILLVQVPVLTPDDIIATTREAFTELAQSRGVQVIILPEDLQVTKLELEAAKVLRDLLDKFIVQKTTIQNN